jgi:hypothetical protein
VAGFGLAENAVRPLAPTVTVIELAPLAPLPPPVSFGAPAMRAVTVAVVVVVSVVCATPLASVFFDVGDTVPALVTKETGTLATPDPPTSLTIAVIADCPPEAGSVCGVAVITIRSAAVAPTLTSIADDAPPENAVTLAVPLWPELISLTVT